MTVEKEIEASSFLSLRKPSNADDENFISKIDSSYQAAKLRSASPDKKSDKFHSPVEFSWRAFWKSMIYENLPPVIFSPLATIFLEGSLSRAWHVSQNRGLAAISTKHHPISFVIQSLHIMSGGEIFVPKIPSYKILDLINAFNMKNNYKVIGIRSGEKIHEEMISNSDSINCLEYKNHYVIFSNSKFIRGYEYFSKNKNKLNEIGKKLAINFNYSSNNNIFLSVSELKKLIKNSIN